MNKSNNYYVLALDFYEMLAVNSRWIYNSLMISIKYLVRRNIIFVNNMQKGIK